MSQARFDLVIDLQHASITWRPLHEALEELDAAGFYPHRFHTVPEQQLARVDHDLGGTLGTEMAGGGGWIIERVTGDALPPVAGCAGYRGAGEDGIAGPFALDGELAPHRMTILLGTLFSLRERGYRRARLAGVKEAAVEALTEQFGASLLSKSACSIPPRPRVVVYASGSGSNFQALIDAVAQDRLHLDIAALIVNKQNAYALQRARAANIAAHEMIWQRAVESRAEFDARLLTQVVDLRPDLVLLLGWMHLLPPAFVAAFPELCNMHPAYLPLDPAADHVVLPDGSMQAAFRGAHAVDDALAAGCAWIGASFHRVTTETDRGAILARAPLRVQNEERAMLDRRLHALEHRLLVDSLAAWQKSN